MTYYPGSNAFTVVWDGVPEYFATGSNSFEITLKKSSNHIDVDYFGLTATDGLGRGELRRRRDLRLRAGEQPQRVRALADQPPQPAGGVRTIRRRTISGLNGAVQRHHQLQRQLGRAQRHAPKGAQISLPFDSIPITSYTEIEPTGGDVDYLPLLRRRWTSLIAEIGGQLDSLLLCSARCVRGPLSWQPTTTVARACCRESCTRFRTAGTTTSPSPRSPTSFTGAGGSGGRYVLDMRRSTAFSLNLGDDSSVEVDLGFTFPFQGQNYTSVFVNSNGNLTFGSGDTDFSESVAELLSDQPRIAPLWDDLSPNHGGWVGVEFGNGSATISFVGVPEFFASTTNTFSVSSAAMVTKPAPLRETATRFW